MIAPVDFYSLVTRAVKYGIQFLALAFMAVFCQELMSKRRVHPVQYLFTGVALVFFYVLLLSLAEHVGFGPAYLAASVATGVMLAAYVGAAPALKGLTMVAVFAGILCDPLLRFSTSRTTHFLPTRFWASPRFPS